MRKRIFAIEATRSMSEDDVADLCELLTLLQKRYHYKWSATYNPGWVRALADEMEKEKGDEK
jgi:hypothetical protein